MSAPVTFSHSPAPALSPEPGVSACSFPGRSFADYVGRFSLDVATLRGKDVLDVAAGASSFAAEARGRKIHGVAVDPLYDCSAAELAGRLYRAHVKSTVGAGRTVRQRASGRDSGLESDRRIAAERFLADYETNFIDNRYVAGALPQLPFLDGTFDLVLCSGLLFVETPGLDPDWNLAACREMMRISAGLVRIFPVCDHAGRAFSGVARLRRELRDAGITTTVRAVQPAGIAAGTPLLELRRAAP